LLDSAALADLVCKESMAFLRQVRGDPAHPLHTFIERQIASISNELRTPGSPSHGMASALRDQIATSPELPKLLADLLHPAIRNLESALRNPESAVRVQAAKMVERGLAVLEGDIDRQRRLDTWVHLQLDDLVSEKHHLIGHVISEELARLPDRELVSQIESKVGDDLQWIRFNGALVGGIVGGFIGTIRYFLPG